MLRDRVKKYYLDEQYNSAESLLHAADDEYALNLPDEAFKMIGGFGNGMGCGRTCGALVAGISVISKQYIEQKAIESPDLREVCRQYVYAFNHSLGSENCDALKAKYSQDDVDCLETVCMAADVLEQVLNNALEKWMNEFMKHPSTDHAVSTV